MEQREIARLFREEEPTKITAKNSSRGESDFREALFVEYADEKLVIKLADNGFTDEEHLTMWMTIAEKYKELGYYCPQFLKALDETTEDAMRWKAEADKLPEKYKPQVERIWANWQEARVQLREIYGSFQGVYDFNELEKQAAPLLYRCIKPLYWNSTDLLKEAGEEDEKIRKCLDFIEYEQTREIDFWEFLKKEL